MRTSHALNAVSRVSMHNHESECAIAVEGGLARYKLKELRLIYTCEL